MRKEDSLETPKKKLVPKERKDLGMPNTRNVQLVTLMCKNAVIDVEVLCM